MDALRGIALFGVPAINLINEFRVSIFQQFLPGGEPGLGVLDRLLQGILAVAIDSKAFALFSLLFGVGLAIQFDRLGAQPKRALFLARRLAVLLAIGLVHLFLIWNGDILTEYAVAAFVVLPFLFAPRRILALGAAAALALYLSEPWLPPVAPFPHASAIKALVSQANSIYPHGGFLEVLRVRLLEIPSILPLHVFVFPRTLALMFFGALLWRCGVLAELEANRRRLGWGVVVGLGGGFALSVLATGPDLFGWPTLGRATEVAAMAAPVVLALAYAATVMWMSTGAWSRGLVLWAVSTGRMAFTNYLIQSIVFGWIFYGYGLGLFNRLTPSGALMIGVAVYVVQIRLSGFWLERFRFGPMEWLWRSAMYGSRQPMTRLNSSPRAAGAEIPR